MEYSTTPIAKEVPEDEIILRLRHAIQEKHRMYLNQLPEGNLREDDAYIIAINSKRIRPIVLDSTLLG